MKKHKIYKNNAGISMVALVITIIVILILASITIAVLLGDNGIIGKMQEARESTEYARAQEEVARKWVEVEREHLTYNEDNDDMAGYLEDKLRDVKDNDNKNETTVRYNDATQTFEIASYKGYDMELQMDGKVTDKGTTPGSGGEEPTHVERASVKINTHPQSQTILAGQSATLTVTLDNEEVTGTVSYQWYEVSSNTSVGGKAVEGENQATYQITNASNNDDKYYYCEVTATYENPTTHQTTTAKEKTTPAKITVITTDITVAQNKVVVDEGETIKLEIQTKNESGITYQWYKTDDPSNLAKDPEKAIEGATQATYEKPNAQTSDDGYYYCIVTKTLNGETIESTSEPIQVTVKIPVEITQEPADIYEMVGRTVQFSVATKGNGTITYQWYKTYQDSNTGGTVISNETGTTLTISNIDLQSDAYYYCEIKQTFEADGSSQTIKTRPAKLSAIDAFRIKTQPESQSKLEGSEVTFSVETSETKGDLTYQWYKTTNSNEAGTPINEANQSTYTIERTKSSDGAYYYVEITQNYNGAIDTIKSEPALLTIVSKVEIATNPTTPIQTIAETEDITFEIQESGQGNMSFQWYVATNAVEPGTPIENTNSRTYTIPKEEVLANLNGTYYYAEVTQTYNNKTAKATSNRALLTVVTPVRVTIQPAPATVTDGNTATFKVETEGTSVPGLTYQWYKTTTNDNTTGEAIQNATSSTYTTPQVTADDNGTYYYCVITQHYGGLTAEARTEPALLTVGQTVQIQDPSDVLVIEHKDNVSFTVGAQGSPAFSYQWYRNTENSNEGGTPITGATQATYTIQKEEVNTNLNGTYYYAKVTQKYGESTKEVTTNAAQLSVVAQAQITTNPTSIKTIAETSNITFIAQATGTSAPTPLSYQWYKNRTGSNTVGEAISGADSETLIISKENVNAELSGTYYYAKVTQQYGISTHEVSTQSALLTVVSPMTITKHPAAVSTIEGKNDVSFSAQASANGTLTYQWYYATSSEGDGNIITGATQSTYTIPANSVTTSLNNRYYYAVITQNYNGVTAEKTTNRAPLTVVSEARITSDPANVSVTAGNTATFEVTAVGTSTPDLTYQWYRADTDSAEGVVIAGATQRTYTTPVLTTADNGKYYYVKVTQTYGSPNEGTTTVISDRAILTVGQAGIIASPANVYTIAGKSAVNFSATATGSGSFTYQWYRTDENGKANLTEDANREIAGETSETYTISAQNVTTSLNNTYYYCIAKQTFNGDVHTLISTAARLSVISQMTVTANIPADVNTIAGKTATFEAGASGEGQITYQWYSNSTNSNTGGTIITGATGSTYTTPTLTTNNNNTYYYCVITQTYGTTTHTTTTPAATLTVVEPIEISSQPTAQSAIAGETATFTVGTNSVEGNVSYQWYRVDTQTGGTPVPITGANQASYTTEPTTVENDNGKYYYCVITQKYGSPETTIQLTTERALLSVTAEGGITVGPKSVSTVEGNEDVSFSVTATGADTLTYQWYKTDQAGSANPSGADNEKINGETSSTYTIAAASVTTALNNTYYYCIVKQAYGTSQKTFISNAAQLTVKDGNYSVTVGTTKTYYDTLELALEEVPNEGTIVQEKNCTDASAPIVRGKDVVFDNNGKTLTKTTAGINVEAGAELEITGDGTITTGESILIFHNYGTLDVTHTGTISDTNTGNIRPIYNEGIFNKTGNGTITSVGVYTTIASHGENAITTISAGTISANSEKNSGTIHVYGNSKTIIKDNAKLEGGRGILLGHDKYGKGTVEIQGGTITGNATFGISIGNGSICTVIGGTITGESNAIHVGNGTLNVGSLESIFNRNNPIIQGEQHGINKASSGRWNFYNGILEGKTAGYTGGEPTQVRSGYGVSTTGMDEEYHTAVLKQTATLTLDKSELNLSHIGDTETITATYNGDGIITAESSNTNIATVSVTNNKITVTPVSAGTATITVSAAEGADYLATTSQTCTVTVNKSETSITATQPGPVVANNPVQFIASSSPLVPGTWTVTSDNPTIVNITGGDDTSGNSTTVAYTGQQAGTAKITITFTPTDSVNYESSTMEFNQEVQEAYYKVGNTYYSTLTSAYQAVGANGTITLQKDVPNEDSDITIDKNVTIDLQNHTLTKTTKEITVASGGTLRIRGTTSGGTTGTITTPLTYPINVTEGTLNVESGIIKSTNASGIGINQTGGTVYVGNISADLSTTNPMVQGETYGINQTAGSWYFYNGIIEGKTESYNGDPAAVRTGYGIKAGTDNGYKTAILKLMPTFSINKSAMELTYGGESDTITITYNGDGELTAVSDHPEIATASLSNKTITVIPVKASTTKATITVSAGEGTNYLAGTDLTCEVTVKQAIFAYTASDYTGEYDGQAHSISVNVTKPSSGYKIYYSTTAALTASNYATAGSEEKPTRTDAGTYTVYWCIVDPTGNYEAVLSEHNTITINRKALTANTISVATGPTSNLNNWSKTPASLFDNISYNTSNQMSNVTFTGSGSDWEYVYLPVVTTVGQTYTFTCDYQNITGFTSTYNGIGMQACKNIPTEDNVANNNAIATTYLPKTQNATSTAYTLTFTAEGPITYITFNFGMCAESTQLQVALGNFTLTNNWSYIYDGNAKEITTVVKDTTRNVNLAREAEYTVAYTDNTNVGTATATLTGIGNYTGTDTQNFTIANKPETPITYDYAVNQQFAAGEYQDTGYVINWDKDFTIEATVNVSELGQRYMIFSSFTSASYRKELIVEFYNNKLRIIFGEKNYYNKLGGTIAANEDIIVTFTWSASSKSYTATATGASSNATISDTYDISGMSSNGLRIGCKDYRRDTPVFVTPITVKSFKVTRSQEYNEAVYLPTVTKEGYTFNGWYTATTGGTQITNATTVPANSTTYYAQYTANNYTASFNGNGGTDGESITKPYGTALGTLPTSTRAGYDFQGWFTEAEGGTQITPSTTMPLNGATYYAHWVDTTAPTITAVTASDTWDIENFVDFTATDAGSGIEAYNISTSTTAPTEWIPVVDAVEAHTETKYQYDAAWARVFHHNTHWGEADKYFANEAEAKSADTIDKYSVLGNLENYRNNNDKYEFLLQYPLIDVTKYNRWIQDDNPVTLNIPDTENGQKVPGYNATHIDWTSTYWGGLARCNSSSFSLLDGSTGHQYAHYAIGGYRKWGGGLTGPGSITSIANLWSRIDEIESSNVSSLSRRIGDLTQNTTYYVWVKDSSGNTSYRNVTINKVDATTPTVSISSTNNVANEQTATLTIEDNVGTVAYYWGTSDPLNSDITWTPITSTTSTTINQTLNENGTYFLGAKDAAGNAKKVSKVFYKTTFNTQKSSVTPDNVITMAGNTFTLPTPTEVPGYTFDGWYTEENGGTRVNTSYKPTGNQTLYAHWTASNYTVSFNPAGGTVSPTSKTVTYGETYGTLPTPTRSGYSFQTWTGKNMFDEETLLMAIPDATYTDGHYVFINRSAADKYGRSNCLPIYGFKENTQYTFGLTGYITGSTSSNRLIVYFFYTDGSNDYRNFTAREENTVMATSTSGKTLKHIRFSYGTSSTVYISHIQLEEGATSTEFEPYQEYSSSTTVTKTDDHTLYAKWNDVTSPIITANHENDTLTYGETLSATLVDNESKVRLWQVNQSSTEPASGWTDTNDGTITKENVAAGTWYIWAKDAAGNVSSKQITVNKAANPITVTNPAIQYTGATVNIASNVSNAQGDVTYAIKTNGTTTASTISGSNLTLGAMNASNDNNQTVVVTATAAGNTNYEASAAKDITVTVQKHTLEIEFTSAVPSSMYYNQVVNAAVQITQNSQTGGTATALTNATFASGSTSVITATGTKNKVLTAVAASGSSVITATLPRSTTVKQATATKTITTTKANITPAPTVTMTGYSYGGTKNEPSISGNIGGGTPVYYYNTTASTTGGTPWSEVTDSTSLPAGDYYIYAVIPETTNYNGTTTEPVPFTITAAGEQLVLSRTSTTAKTGATINIEDFVTSHEGALSYAITTNGTTTASSLSGSNLTLGAMSDENDNDQTVVVTITAAATGSYTQDSKTLTITVQKHTRTLAIASSVPSSIPYQGTATADVTISGSGGTANNASSATYATSNSSVITVNGTTLTAVAPSGSTVITATLPRTTTVKEATASKTITAVKANMTPAPTVSMTGYKYGGTKSTPSINDNIGGGTPVYYYNTSNSNSNGIAWSTVTDATSLNAGDYWMYAEIPETTNYNSAKTATVKFTIEKGEVALSDIPTELQYVGKGMEKTISATAPVPGDWTITSSDGNVSISSGASTTNSTTGTFNIRGETASTTESTITVSFTPTSSNYAATTETFTAKVTDLSLSSNSETIVLGNGNLTSTISSTNAGTISVDTSASGYDATVATASISGNTLTVTPVSVGTATITIKETNANKTATFTATITVANYSVSSGSPTYHTTLATACGAVGANGTVTVLANNTDTSTVAIGKKITLDLQTYTITRAETITINTGNTVNITGTGTITSTNTGLTNNGVLNITDSSIISTGSNTSYSGIANNETLRIYNGKIKGVFCGIDNGNDPEKVSTVTINGGTVETTGESDTRCGIKNVSSFYRYLSSKKVVTINEGTVSGGTYGIYSEGNVTNYVGNNNSSVSTTSPTILGGSYGLFSDYINASNYLYNGILKGTISGSLTKKSLSYRSEYTGFKGTETIDGITYKTEYLSNKIYSITANETTAYYITLKSAVDAAEDGQTIKTLIDCEDTSIVSINKNITLDIQEYTIKKDYSNITVDSGYTFNIQGTGTITSTLNTGTAPIENNGILNITNSTIIGKKYSGIENNGILTINNAIVQGISCGINNANKPRVSSTVTINGGTIETIGTSETRYGINNTSDFGNTKTVTINNGTIKGGTYGIYNVGEDSITNIGDISDILSINNPSVIGDLCGIYNDSGEWNFYNGRILGITKIYNEVPKNIRSGYGVSTAVDENTYNVAYLSENSLIINQINSQVVKGNSITAEISGDITGELTAISNDPSIATVTISGATVTISGIETGQTIITVTDSNNKSIVYNVTIIDQYYSISNSELTVYYHTLQDAINDARENQTIKVVQNVTDKEYATVDKNLNIDLQTYTLTRNRNITINSQVTLNIFGTGKIESDNNIDVIVNNGILNILTDLTIENTSIEDRYAILNFRTVNISNGTILGVYNTIMNANGTINITGGTVKTTSTTGKRSAITNGCYGTGYTPVINITGGTIETEIGTSGEAFGISNKSSTVLNCYGLVNIGSPTGELSTNTPKILGQANGINNSSPSKWSFYSGIIGSNTGNAYNERPTLVRDGYEVVTGTNIFNEITYNTAYLDNSSFYVTPRNITVDIGETETINLGGSGYGAVTVESSDSSKATATVSGSTVTINGIAKGTATLTFTEANNNKTDTCYVTIINKNYSITKNTVTNYYETLAEAVARAVYGDVEGDTIKVEKDVSDTSTVSINKNVIIDLNGHIISRNNKMITIREKENTVTIKSTNASGKIISVGNVDTISNYGTLNITEDVTIENKASMNSYSAIANNGIINMNSGTVQGVYKGINNSYSSTTESEVNISGTATVKATIASNSTSNNVCGIYNYGTDATYTKMVNISGGTVGSTENMYGIYNYGEAAEVTVTDGRIYGQTNGIFNSASATVDIGSEGATLSNSSPEISGGEYGINSTTEATWDFYNGIIKGTTAAYDGAYSARREDTYEMSGTDGDYKTAYLQQYIPVYTAEQMSWVGDGQVHQIAQENNKEYTFSVNGKYTLKNDIDLSSECSATLGSWTPRTLTGGEFEGNGHEIQNLYINNTTSSSWLGLFGSISESKIRNLGITGTVSSSRDNTMAALCGYVNESCEIINCYSNATVTATISSGGAKVGGLIGMIANDLNIINGCHNAGTVTGGNFTGGLIGYAETSVSINNCYNTGAISSTGIKIGGLIGEIVCENSTITDSYNMGTVSGNANLIGGLCGRIESTSNLTVSRCYNLGNVIAESSADYSGAGGLVGSIINTNIEQSFNKGIVIMTSMHQNCRATGITGNAQACTVKDCYNTGKMIISDPNNADNTPVCAGIVGQTSNASTVENCYNIGNTICNDDSFDDCRQAAIVGCKTGNSDTITNCHYLTGTAPYEVGAYAGGGFPAYVGNAKTTAELQVNSFITTLNASRSPEVWAPDTNINDGYPILVWQGQGEARTLLTPTFSLSNSSGTVMEGNTLTEDITYIGDGTLTAYSNNTSIATATIDGDILRITGVAEGTTTIMVMASSTQDYLGAALIYTITVQPANYYITSGGITTYYSTLSTAVAAADDEDTIVQNKNCTDASIVTVTNKNITFNNNGKTLTRQTNTITISSGATLTISGSGTITATDLPTNLLYCNGGTLNITHTGTISANGANIYRAILVANGGTMNKTGSGSIVSYSSLHSTIGCVGSDSTVNLSNGIVDGTSSIYAVQCYNHGSVDISGSTILRSSYSAALLVGATTTDPGYANMSGGRIENGSDRCVRVLNGSSFTMSGGTIECTSGTTGVAVYIWKNSTMEMTGGTVNSTGRGILSFWGCTFNMTGGSVTTSGTDNTTRAVQVNWGDTNGGADTTTNINGGTISGGYIGLIVSGGGTANITGGTIAANNFGVYCTNSNAQTGSSTMTITGGNISATSSTTLTSNSTNFGAYCQDQADGKGKPVIYIYGGTISGGPHTGSYGAYSTSSSNGTTGSVIYVGNSTAALSTSIPKVQGTKNGIGYNANVKGKVYFGNGILYGKTSAIPTNANLEVTRTGATIKTGTDNGYNTAYLEVNLAVGNYSGVYDGSAHTFTGPSIASGVTAAVYYRANTAITKDDMYTNSTYTTLKSTSALNALGISTSKPTRTNVCNDTLYYYIVSSNSSYNGKTGSAKITITAKEPTLTLSSASISSINYNATGTFTATVKSGTTGSVAGTLTATSASSTYVSVTGGSTQSVTATTAGVTKTITYKGARARSSATNITVKFTPSSSNYSEVTKTFSVNKVNQIAPTLSVSNATVIGHNTTSVTVTYTGDGTLSASSSNTSVATVGISDKTVTITGATISAGTATLTVTAAAGTNYTAKTATSTITVQAALYEVSAGTPKYHRTLASAVSTCTAGGTVKALADTSESGTVTVDKSLTINTNEKTLTRTSGDIKTSAGTLTINGGGSITCSQTSKSRCITVNGGNLSVTGSTILSGGNGGTLGVLSNTTVTLNKCYIRSGSGKSTINVESACDKKITIVDSYIYSDIVNRHTISYAGSKELSIDGNSRIGYNPPAITKDGKRNRRWRYS